ncbi:permease [Tepidibacter formicigenes]|jgi:uncharacterized membrane protein YraQ (UPF0718 family)|uniref:Permease n=1 Tax=Tepidibacter formicigenes DSM 15518 TaxID=1123349 RepID=A0A1M6M3I0_9FIRM|nr:permease [Tepidibacter formicigenes]SHJ78011.1 hypothetical protein SAMN02744037_00813 [Tepidibacter formicigenes DSM 15518]
MISTVLLILSTIIALGISLKKDKNKTIQSIGKARGMMGGMISDIIGILLLIGLILALIPPDKIRLVLGGENLILTTVGAATIGTITLIPAFVAFPLIGSLKDSGANILVLTAFLTTLTMVGFITFPIEKDIFGKKFATWRNIISFITAILIALGMGVIL